MTQYVMPHPTQLTHSIMAFSGDSPPSAPGTLAPTMPKPRRPHVASADEVRITRNGDYAEIEYADPKVAVTSLQLGREKVAAMTDTDILNLWNESIEAREEYLRSHPFNPIEIPVGKPQVEYVERSDQWVPRGHVVRAVLLYDSAMDLDLDEPFVCIDDRDFNLREFVRMLGTFGGWGMRITFVGDDSTHERPRIRVREPKERKKRRSKR